MTQPLESRPPSAATPLASAVVPRRDEGSDAYRRMLEELATVVSPAVARRVLDAALVETGVAPGDAAPYDLRFALWDRLPGELAEVLRDDEATDAVLASLEEALVSAHRPPRVGESGSLPGVISRVGPARLRADGARHPSTGARGREATTAPAPPPRFSTAPATPLSLRPPEPREPRPVRFSSPVPPAG